MAIGILMVIGFIVFLLVLPALFIMTLYATLMKVEAQHRTFFPCLVWLMLIPLFGYFFSWYFLLVGIPNTLRKAVNTKGRSYIKKLFYVALGAQLVALLAYGLIFSPRFSFLTSILTIVSFVFFIIYWRMVHIVGKKYLSHSPVSK